MYVILSLQLFSLIRELLTDKFQVIHKVCIILCQIIFYISILQCISFEECVLFLFSLRPFKEWINLGKDIYPKECFIDCLKGK